MCGVAGEEKEISLPNAGSEAASERGRWRTQPFRFVKRGFCRFIGYPKLSSRSNQQARPRMSEERKAQLCSGNGWVRSPHLTEVDVGAVPRAGETEGIHGDINAFNTCRFFSPLQSFIVNERRAILTFTSKSYYRAAVSEFIIC